MELRYRNPVYPYYFADPFVWEHEGRYYAVGTGALEQKAVVTDADLKSVRIGGEVRAFPLLTSPNLIDWTFVGGALRVPDYAIGGDFWAPEVAYHNGKFYLYYSVASSGLNHVLRVAASNLPTGPYVDVGPVMQNPDAVPFAIDAHPFKDDDGNWYLFYARDFLDFNANTRAGTALVVDRLVDMVKLAGEEKVVLRARCDWQLFQSNRTMYGKIYDWHTLEGPSVLKHEGKYYCFYSGGCYQNETYGVDYGVADRVTGPYTDKGNEKGARVLRTSEELIGPGHNSFVKGPDGKTYMVYHAWDKAMSGRRMCIDPLEWTKNGPKVVQRPVG